MITITTLPTANASPASALIGIKKQDLGLGCSGNSPLRTRLERRRLAVWVPSWKEDQTVRWLVKGGMTMHQAYRAAGIGAILPPDALAPCLDSVYREGQAGPETCRAVQYCLALSVQRVYSGWPGGGRPLPIIGPRIVPQAWIDWIDQVQRLLPQYPPPDTPMFSDEGGLPEEWLLWLQTVAPLVPQLPPPEPIPGVTPPEPEPPPVHIPPHIPPEEAAKFPWGLAVVGVLALLLVR